MGDRPTTGRIKLSYTYTETNNSFKVTVLKNYVGLKI